MTREEMIKKLMWNSGGTGFGPCERAGVMIWNDMKPKTPEEDWISVVAIQGDPDRYTDGELEKLVIFSEERTKRYDGLFRWRMGCNLIFIGKEFHWDGHAYWFRKRMTWKMGSMYSETLDEALEVFRRN